MGRGRGEWLGGGAIEDALAKDDQHPPDLAQLGHMRGGGIGWQEFETDGECEMALCFIHGRDGNREKARELRAGFLTGAFGDIGGDGRRRAKELRHESGGRAGSESLREAV